MRRVRIVPRSVVLDILVSAAKTAPTVTIVKVPGLGIELLTMEYAQRVAAIE